jgi:predicted transcriptional regulator of viral defense system
LIRKRRRGEDCNRGYVVEGVNNLLDIRDRWCIIHLILVLFIALLENEMRYIELHEQFKDFTVFSLNDIRSIDPGFHRRRLNDWQEKGYLRKVVKGYYMFSDTSLNENILFETANRIYTPSYISLEMALSYYGLVPEAVYGITSVTTRLTRTFSTQMGEFLYRTLRPRLFYGYTIVEYSAGKHFMIASPEKAVLDYFYLHPSAKKTDDFEELRFNGDSFFQHVKESVFFEYLQRFRHTSLTGRMHSFWEFMRNA